MDLSAVLAIVVLLAALIVPVVMLLRTQSAETRKAVRQQRAKCSPRMLGPLPKGAFSHSTDVIARAGSCRGRSEGT